MIPCLDDVEFVSLGEDTATVFVVFILLKLKVVTSDVMIMSGSELQVTSEDLELGLSFTTIVFSDGLFPFPSDLALTFPLRRSSASPVIFTLSSLLDSPVELSGSETAALSLVLICLSFSLSRSSCFRLRL